MPMLRTRKKLLCAAVFGFLFIVWISQRYLQSVDVQSDSIPRRNIFILDSELSKDRIEPSVKGDAGEIDPNLFAFTAENLLSNLNFSNVNGGSWKQGWPIVYDRRLLSDLEVFIVPHSHVDVGWVKTIDSYYDYVKSILDNVIGLMQESPGRRFVWSEIVYLKMWWDDERTSDSLRSTLKDLILSGKFEILTGGWVIPDEASCGFESMVDQLILGHQWIEQHIGKFKVNCTFPMDIFGAGTSMPHIAHKAGIRFVALQRVHYILKKHLAKAKLLEFLWRVHPRQKGQMMAHIQPFYSYDVPHTCGPEPEICCAFDFERMQTRNCPWQYQPVYPSPRNIYGQASRLSDQYRKKATLYKYPVLLVPLGDDFRYKNAKSALTQFEGYEILMNYINSKQHWKMKVRFGTLSEYFEALQKHVGKSDDSLRTFSGDFFPYADKDQEYWTGYFVSRPHFKSLTQQIQTILRTIELLHYFSRGFKDATRDNEVMAARRISAVLQHHDSITGTSPTHVVNDLMNRIRQFYLLADTLLSKPSSELTKLATPPIPFFSCSVTPSFDGCDKPATLYLEHQNSTKLMLFNPLEEDTEQLLRLRLDIPVPVKLISGKDERLVAHQISPIASDKSASEISFVAKLGSLTFETYEIQRQPNKSKDDNEAKIYFGKDLLKNDRDASPLEIRNDNFKITVESSNLIALRARNDNEILASFQVVEYRSSDPDFHPGAYICIMGTDDRPVDFDLKSEVTILKGPIYSSIRLKKPNRIHVDLTLIKDDLPSKGIHVNVNTDLSGLDENIEVALRFINREKLDKIFTDSNGLQMTPRRAHRHLPGQANIYPFTRLVQTKSESKQWSVLSGQPRSVHLRSELDNILEFILHRVTAKDDDRGMGEPLVDEYPSSHRFIFFPQDPTEVSNEADRLLQSITHPLQQFAISSDAHMQSYSLIEPNIETAHIVSITSLSNDGRFLAVLAETIVKDRKVRLDRLLSCNRYYRSDLTGWEPEGPMKSCSEDALVLDEPLISVVFLLD